MAYSIVGGSTEDFELIIDGESVNVVNKNELDRESLDDSVLSLTIEALETEHCPANGCLKTETECMLLIEDMNDNPPEFNYPQYTASVKESVTLGEIIPWET